MLSVVNVSLQQVHLVPQLPPSLSCWGHFKLAAILLLSGCLFLVRSRVHSRYLFEMLDTAGMHLKLCCDIFIIGLVNNVLQMCPDRHCGFLQLAQAGSALIKYFVCNTEKTQRHTCV